MKANKIGYHQWVLEVYLEPLIKFNFVSNQTSMINQKKINNKNKTTSKL